MEPTSELDRALDSLRSLREALDDPSASLAVVRADGHWHLEEGTGPLSPRETPLSADVSSALVSAVHRNGPTVCLDEWWIRPHRGGATRSVVLQRRPTVEPRGLSDHTLELLQTRLPSDGDGVVFGPDRSARSGVLTSLVRWMPADFVVYVGEAPPMSADELSLHHVAPPRNDRDRRRLATVAEGASAVLFDGPVAPADLRLLSYGEDSAVHWISIAATDPDEWIRRLGADRELARMFDARIGVRGSAGDSIRLDYLGLERADGRDVLLDRGETGTGPGASPETTVPDDTGHEVVEVTRSMNHDSGPEQEPTTNPETPSIIRDDSDRAEAEHHSAESTGRASAESDEIRESGEIEVSAPREEPGIESGSSLEEKSTTDDEIRGERIDDDLPELVANRDVDDVEIPKLDARRLRRTFEGDVDVETLREERRKQRREARRDRDGSPSEQGDAAGRAEETGLGAESSIVEDGDRGDEVSDVDELSSDPEPETDVLGDEESQTEEMEVPEPDVETDELGDDESEPPETTEFTAPEPETETSRVEVEEADEASGETSGEPDDETERMEVRGILDAIEEGDWDDSI